MLSVSGKLEVLNHVQLNHVQVGHKNKAEEFWKSVQTAFLRRKDLSYVQDRGHVNQVKR